MKFNDLGGELAPKAGQNTMPTYSEWNEIFPNAACVVSLIDRLMHHSEVIAIEGESYRMKEAQECAAERRKIKKRGKAK